MTWTESPDLMTLEEDQAEVVDAIVADTSGACLVAGDLGSGKTVISVESIRALDAKRVLIVCPLKNTLGFHRPGTEHPYDGWIGTLRRQGYAGPITTLVDRICAENDSPGVYIVGREMMEAITRKTKNRPEWSWAKAPQFDLVIFDEVHRLQNRKSAAVKAATKIPTKYRVGLSGTPWGNSFSGAWSVTKWHWPKDIDASYWRWAYTYAQQVEETVFVAGKAKTVRTVAGEQEPGRFVSELPNYHRLERHYDVYYHQLYVDLTPKQQRVYNAMLEDMFVWLDDNPMVAKLPLERRIRLREMTLAYPSLVPNAKFDSKSGELKDVVYFEDTAESAKIDSVKEFLSDHDEPTFLLTHSKKFAKVAALRLGAKLIDGDTSDKDRNEIKDGFIAKQKGFQNVVATIPTIAEGMDGLQRVCRTAIFFSRQDSRILNEQVIGRFARRGQDHQVNVIDVLALNTFDMLNLEDQNEAGIEYLRSLRKGG